MTVSKPIMEWEMIAAGLAKITEEKILLPPRVSYTICKNRLKMEQALLPFRMTKDDIINRYSDGKGEITEKDNPELFKKVCMEITAMAGEMMSLDIDTISLYELSVCQGLPLNVMAALSFMITEQEE